MKRWNGWGNSDFEYPIKPQAVAYLQETLGAGNPHPDATLEDVVLQVPESRLVGQPLISTNTGGRAGHAVGQSFGDWVAMRSGQYPAFPDGVAYPTSADDVRQLIRYARDTGTRLIPYGGGTSVVGHINPQAGDAPVLTVDMGRMNQLLRLDTASHLATFGAGVTGPDLEAQLRAQGYTLGHFPQSFEHSTLGGWVATRSSGQQSLYYGRIERLFVGGHVETPLGSIELPTFPASAAGPDLREAILGSEGRLGIITDATVQVMPLPEVDEFRGIFFPTFEDGAKSVRAMAQAKLPLSMLRLSNATETLTNLTMAGHQQAIGLMEQYLKFRGADDEKCLLVMGATGTKALTKMAVNAALDIAKGHGGVHLGTMIGKQWAKNRFKGAYLRNTLWDMGYGVDTLETAVNWHSIPKAMYDIEAALKQTLNAMGEKGHVFTHLSHVYPHGSSVYTTYLFRLADTAEQTLENWKRLKAAASEQVVANGGTISHQHGVGLDHAPYLQAEKGEIGMGALRNTFKYFDPDGIMNPGKLI